MPTRQLSRLVAASLATVALLGCGSDPADEPLRSYTMQLRTDDSGDRYQFVAVDPIDIRVGDEVTFEMSNTGTLIHDLQVVDPAGTAIGVAAPVAPGGVASVTVTFDEAGLFRLNCLVDDHLTSHRMQAVVEVTDPDT